MFAKQAFIATGIWVVAAAVSQAQGWPAPSPSDWTHRFALSSPSDQPGGAATSAAADAAPAADSPTPGGGAASDDPTGPARSETTAAGAQAGAEGGSTKPPAGDTEKQKELEAAAAAAYKGLYFDNEFDYLNDPAYRGWHLGESLKRRPLGPGTTLDVGGEYRLRYHHENNIRGLGLTGLDDDFLLHRTRVYGNLEVGERFRFYAEMLDAVSEFEDYRPRGIEENRADLLNLFGDYKLLDAPAGDLWVRIGRQELLYGAQRLISPLDWANTRRTFEGGKLFWRGENWDIDAFWVQPVAVRANRFDAPIDSEQFTGVYSTYKGIENQKLDLYYLFLGEDEAATDFHLNTLGNRWEAARDNWLVETEAAVQLGDYGGADHRSAMLTGGLGRKMPRMPWQPVLWAYYDWASGDDIIGNGFNHLFPLAHRYLGYMDLFGRRNIQDINFLLTAKPHAKLTLTAWGHLFYLQDRDDVPYSVVLTPEVPQPGGSRELGQEIDLLADWNVTARQNVILGYSHFFSGDFYRTNPSPPPYSGDADFFYSQYMLRF